MSDSSWIRLETFSWTKKSPKMSSCLQQTIKTEKSIFLLLELPPGFFAGLFRFHWIFVHWEGNVFFTESLLYFMSSQFWNKHTKLWLTISRKPLNLNLQAVSIKPQCVCVVCRFGPLMCAVYDFTGPQFLFDQPETCEDFQFAFATKSPQSAKKENSGNDFPFSFNF